MASESAKQYTGPKRYVEYQEAAGKTVQYLRYWHSPEGGQLITIQFTDSTRGTIQIKPLLHVTTEIDELKDGNLKSLKTYPVVLGSPHP